MCLYIKRTIQKREFKQRGNIIMRKEATLEQWKELYETATRIKEMKPWDYLWDMDIIAIQNGAEEDTVFCSILGRGGTCYGIAVYEGYEAFNTYMMMAMQQKLNLPVDYVMYKQKNLTCYWGDREELSDKQRKTIKDLGYKYRGKNQWLYFMSYEPDYFPYNMNQAEVLRMTEHLNSLELALKYYVEKDVTVKFDEGNMFLLKFVENKKTWSFGEEPLPFTSFQYGNLLITDEELLEELKDAGKNDTILEMDISYLGTAVSDKKYDRPANPALCMIAEAKTGMILKCEMQEPEVDAMISLAEELIGFILQCGAPKEVRVSNIIVEAGLEQICETCRIKLRRVKRLTGVEEFKAGMMRFR